MLIFPLRNRWGILATLFFSRMTMAFQFQSVAALANPYMDYLAINLSEIGFLIGLYFIPGLFIALPGGAIGKFFGDKRTIIFGLVLMVAGAAIVWASLTWEMQLTGRIVGGIGGTILNVLMSKLVVDYFKDNSLNVAMGIFVTSWPIGIAVALLCLPMIFELSSFQAALFSITALTVFALALFTCFVPTNVNEAMAKNAATALRGKALLGLLLLALVWAFYNGAIAMIFGFATPILSEKGMAYTEASKLTGLTLWIIAIAVPIGGFMADKFNSPKTFIAISLTGFAITMPLVILTQNYLIVFICMGIMAGLPAGPIMGLPAKVLNQGNSAFGMGLFFTIYYLVMVLSPFFAGWFSDVQGTASFALFIGIGMLGLALLSLFLFQGLKPNHASLKNL